MICEICGGRFSPSVTFATFAHPPRFCPHCRRRYEPGRFLECIPISGGLVRSLTVYDAENADHHLSTLLADRLAPLYLEASEWAASGAAVVLLELREAADFETWFPVLSAFRDVRFFALFRIDFERFEGLF